MIELLKPLDETARHIFSSDALQFVEDLHNRFNSRREDLLTARIARQERIRHGELPRFLEETERVRHLSWSVAPCPVDLEDRRVEITGPVERKMMINALNSGARVFMADLEDSNSPTWQNVTEGQVNLYDAVRRTISFQSPEGKSYSLNSSIATLMLRPRGWHLEEKQVLVDGKAISASLFDFGIFFFHNAAELLKRGSGPYFYLPKMESYHEARLWNDVFIAAQEICGVPRGSIRATVLIETILAAFEMEEILYELREHAAGLNAGRWDYLFSIIKKFSHDPAFVLPDRSQLTMITPFMHAYTELLVKTCHTRGASAIGGMAAFIPNRRDPEVTERALNKVREDKERESSAGFDGTWVAHPDLVQLATDIFSAKLGHKKNQREVKREEVNVAAEQLLNVSIHGSSITESGVRLNISVALQYIERWLAGVGAVAIHNLMEDAATAEISRAQLWQWRTQAVKLDSGAIFTADLYRKFRDEEVDALKEQGRDYSVALTVLDTLVCDDTFQEFLTTSAYQYLD